MGAQAIPIFPSRDLDATISFYGRLGFGVAQRIEGSDPYLVLHRDTIELHFFQWDIVDPWASIASCFVRVEQVEDWFTAFAAAELPREGIPRMSEPVDTPFGVREFALVDLDGNLLRVGAPLGE